MERLTEKVFGFVQLKACGNDFCKETCAEHDEENSCKNCHIQKAFEKLAEYEDLDEQGLLLRLPCKIGDKVLDNDYGNPCAYTITGFSVGIGEDCIDEPVSSKEVVYYYSNYSGTITGSFAVSELGKTVFLTQAEAEQKLKEMDSK